MCGVYGDEKPYHESLGVYEAGKSISEVMLTCYEASEPWVSQRVGDLEPPLYINYKMNDVMDDGIVPSPITRRRVTLEGDEVCLMPKYKTKYPPGNHVYQLERADKTGICKEKGY
jgi:hypothetical protein